MKPQTLLLLALFATWTPALIAADPPHVHTSRTSQKILPLPKGDDVFHFIVFGDRTGGPAEGIKVLAQGVEEANLLDPDLVMTVGDLVNGYNQTEAWMEQMTEFHATMNRLNMPWFPVAGNHDIYWRRSARNPEARPAQEHEESYEKHFGPLWYWFEHKASGFLVLFSDEGLPDGRPRDFGDPAQQNFSRTQMDWLAAELGRMRHLTNIFVFLHHPRWVKERYSGSDWNQVHQLLAATRNVRAVFAGHIHQMRYDGERDGIGYYALATTGGSLTPGMEYRHFGLIHHFNVVTVRNTNYSVAAIPVGSVFDPKQFTPERLKDVEAARYTLHEFVSPPIPIKPDSSASAIYQVAVTNPCTLPIEVTILAKGDDSWTLAPDHRHAELRFQERHVFEFACFREPSGGFNNFEAPEFELRFDVLTPGARLPMPVWSLRARTQLATAPGDLPAPAANQGLVLNGTDACLEIDRQDLPRHNGPFTVEAWVKPEAGSSGGLVANIHIGGFALDLAGTPRFCVQTDERPADSRRVPRISPWTVAKAATGLTPGQWTHLAGVYDGEQIILYVNGQRSASAAVQGARLDSNKTLYVGARPAGNWNLHDFSQPAAFWTGMIDEVRISRGARYEKEFAPTSRLQMDPATALALPNDQRVGPFVPLAAPAPVQARIKGGLKLAPVER